MPIPARLVLSSFSSAVAIVTVLAFAACGSSSDDAPNASDPDGASNVDGSIGDPDGSADGETDEDAGACDPKADSGPLVCRWRWQTPAPTGDDLYGVHAFAEDDVFAMTSGGRLLHRAAGGWGVAAVQPPKKGGGRDLGGTNDGHLYMFVDGIHVLHSPDRGASWSAEYLPRHPEPASYDVAMAVDRQSGWALVVGVGGAMKTRDPATGQWAVSRFGGSGRDFYGVHLGSPRWFAVGVDGARGVIATTTQGSPNGWTLATVPPETTALHGVCSGTTGATTRYWAVAQRGTILSSTDGLTWAAQPGPAVAPLVGCTAVDASTAFVFGGSRLYRTTDGGTTWTLVETGASGAIQAASTSPGSQTTTFVGMSGKIVRMVGGAPMVESGGANDKWSAVAAVSRNELYAVGAGGAIARTTDGKRWDRLSTNQPDAVLNAVWTPGANDVYAVGNKAAGGDNYVLHSTDGVTFPRYARPEAGGVPANASLNGVAGLNANKVYISSTTGIYRSTDQGASWSPSPITGFSGGEITTLYADASGLWIGASEARVFFSADGDTFKLIQLPVAGAFAAVRAIASDTAGNVYASVTGDKIARITGAGAEVTVTAGPGSRGFGVSPSGAALFAASADSFGPGQLTGLLLSVDHGATFTAPFPEIENGVLAVKAVGDDRIYALVSTRAGGGIMHWGN